jgi:hypothetical protein
MCKSFKKYRTVKKKKRLRNSQDHISSGIGQDHGSECQDDTVRVDKDDLSAAENGIVAIITVLCVKNEV